MREFVRVCAHVGTGVGGVVVVVDHPLVVAWAVETVVAQECLGLCGSFRMRYADESDSTEVSGSVQGPSTRLEGGS